MVHMNAHPSAPRVDNMPHQHAFVLVGGLRDGHPLFGVHMTQYHCEIHKYQIILEMKIEPHVLERLNILRHAAPRDCFVLCNARANPETGVTEMTIPELASGERAEFTANIFQGLRPFGPEAEKQEHFFPWDAQFCRPAIAEVQVTVRRVAFFRPFAHNEPQPRHPTYFLWGKAQIERQPDGSEKIVGEAHMTNLQTAALAVSAFEAPAWGPDYDHAMSLAEPPQWLDPMLLRAGVVVSVPGINLQGDVAENKGIPKDLPFAEGEQVTVLYRGMGTARRVIAGASYFSGTAVCNSPEIDPFKGTSLNISVMPREYWV